MSQSVAHPASSLPAMAAGDGAPASRPGSEYFFLRRSMFTAADHSSASLLLSVAGTSPVNVHSVVRSNSLSFLRQVCILLLDCLLLFRGTLPGAQGVGPLNKAAYKRP